MQFTETYMESVIKVDEIPRRLIVKIPSQHLSPSRQGSKEQNTKKLKNKHIYPTIRTQHLKPTLSRSIPIKGPNITNTTNGIAIIVPVSYRSKLNLSQNISPEFQIKGQMQIFSIRESTHISQKSALNFLIFASFTVLL